MGLTTVTITGIYQDPSGELLKGKSLRFTPVRVFGDSGIVVPMISVKVITDATTGAFSIPLLTSDLADAYIRYQVTFHDNTKKKFDLTDDETTVSLEDLINAFDGAAAPSAVVTLADHEDRIDDLSIAVDNLVLGAASVTSQAFSVMSARVDLNSSQMTSADDALSVRTNSVANAISIVSNAISAEISARAAADAALSVRIDTVGGSVTSQEFSTAAAALSSRIDTASNAASIVSAAQALTSAAVVSVNDRVSGISTVVTNNSAQMTSADNAISAAQAATSAAQAATSAAVTSVNNRVSGISSNVTSIGTRVDAVSALISSTASALSARIDVVSNALSANSVVLSNTRSAVLANSAQMVSADNAISNAVSIVSVAQAATSAAVTSVNDRVSGISTAVTNNSAQMTSADNAISAAQAATSAAVTSVNNRISGISATVTNNSAQMTSADNAISNAVSVVSAYVNKAIGSEFAGGNISAGSVAIDWANGRNQAFSIQGSVAIAAPTNGSAGASYILRFVQDGTGNRQATWNSAFVFEGSTPPTFGGASAVDIVGFYYDGATYYGTGAAIGGSGSVTSAELSAASAAAASAISIVSAAVVSVNNRVSGISSNVASIAGRVDTNSAQMTSADNAISNAVSIVSAYVNKAVGMEYAGGNISAGSVVINWANGRAQAFSIQGSVAIAAPTNGSAGATYLIRFVQDGTGNRQATWNSANFTFQGGLTPTLGGASAVDIVGFYYDGTTYYGRHDTQSIAGGVASVTSAEYASALDRISGISSNVTSIGTRLDAVSALISTAASALSVRIDAASNAASIVSAAVAVNSAQMTSADNAISNAVSIVSVAQAATSAAVTSVNNRVSGISTAVTNNSAQMTSADNAISAAVVAVSALVSTVASALSARIDTVSNALSAKTISSLIGVSIGGATDQQALVYNSADGKWHASTITGGSGSVTSTELSAASAAALANDNAVSAQAASIVSVLSAALSTATSALSVRIDTVSNATSVVSVAAANAHSLASQAFSVASAVSAAQAATSAAVTSVNNRVSAISSNVTSIGTRLDTNSAQFTSADNAISNAVSVVSAYVNKAVGMEFAGGNLSTGSVVIDWSNGRAQAFSILSAVAIAAPVNGSAGATYLLRFQQDGTGSKQVTWNSANFSFNGGMTPTLGGASAVDLIGFYYDGTKYYGRHDTQSVGISVTSAEFVSALDRISALSVVVSNAVSAIAANSAQMTSADNALSVQINAVSANAQSANNALSARVGPFLDTQFRMMSGDQSDAGSALTNLSGLLLTVGADQTWIFQGVVLVSTSATTTGLRFGTSVPPLSTPRYIKIVAGSAGQSATIAGGGGQLQVSGNSANMSITAIGPAGAMVPIWFDGMFNTTSSGIFKIKTCGIASTAQSPLTNMKGSYFTAFRIK